MKRMTCSKEKCHTRSEVLRLVENTSGCALCSILPCCPVIDAAQLLKLLLYCKQQSLLLYLQLSIMLYRLLYVSWREYYLINNIGLLSGTRDRNAHFVIHTSCLMCRPNAFFSTDCRQCFLHAVWILQIEMCNHAISVRRLFVMGRRGSVGNRALFSSRQMACAT